MDISENIAGLSTTATALELAKAIQAKDFADAMRNMHDAALRDQAINELQTRLHAAQQEQRALLETINALQREVAELKQGMNIVHTPSVVSSGSD